MKAMALQNKTFEDLDAVLGKGRYLTKRFVTSLAAGKTTGTANIVEITEALGMDIVFKLEPKP